MPAIQFLTASKFLSFLLRNVVNCFLTNTKQLDNLIINDAYVSGWNRGHRMLLLARDADAKPEFGRRPNDP